MISFEVLFGSLVTLVAAYISSCVAIYILKKNRPELKVKMAFILITIIFAALIFFTIEAHLSSSLSGLFYKFGSWISWFYTRFSSWDGFFVFFIASLASLLGPSLIFVLVMTIYGVMSNGPKELYILFLIPLLIVFGWFVEYFISIGLYALLIYYCEHSYIFSIIASCIINLGIGILAITWLSGESTPPESQ